MQWDEITNLQFLHGDIQIPYSGFENRENVKTIQIGSHYYNNDLHVTKDD